MKHISFAWTSPALLAGAKTVTRREWNPNWARGFSAGELVAAYDRDPRARGQQIATIRLTQAPSFEPNSAMPDSDYEAEGLAWLFAHPEALPKSWPLAEASLHAFELWRRRPGSMWVVRFELVRIWPNLPPNLARWANRAAAVGV